MYSMYWCISFLDAIPCQVRVRWRGSKPTKAPERQDEAAPRQDGRTIENNICDESSGGNLLQMIQSVEWGKFSVKPIKKIYPKEKIFITVTGPK